MSLSMGLATQFYPLRTGFLSNLNIAAIIEKLVNSFSETFFLNYY
jgi:hypothetical protein